MYDVLLCIPKSFYIQLEGAQIYATKTIATHTAEPKKYFSVPLVKHLRCGEEFQRKVFDDMDIYISCQIQFFYNTGRL
jgi:hypothetical protein